MSTSRAWGVRRVRWTGCWMTPTSAIPVARRSFRLASYNRPPLSPFAPAEAGAQGQTHRRKDWVPAFAGTNGSRVSMNFAERLADIRARMQEEKLDLLLAVHDGGHFIEKPNPVMVLSGFKSLGPAAALLHADGAIDLIVTPHWDAERAAEFCPDARVVGAEDVVDSALAKIKGNVAGGTSGLHALPYTMASRFAAALPSGRSADKLVFDAARTKTSEEIANARAAARIAERGYERLLEIARPGMSEDELAVELKWYMKTL